MRHLASLLVISLFLISFPSLPLHLKWITFKPADTDAVQTTDRFRVDN